MLAHTRPDVGWSPEPGRGDARQPPLAPIRRQAGTIRAALERQGVAQVGAKWGRSKGCGEAVAPRADECSRGATTPPIFVWELVEGLRLRPPKTVDEACGAAMLVMAAVGSKRPGAVKGLKVAGVMRKASDTVSLLSRARRKTERESAAKRRAVAKPIRIKHWLVREYVLPWLEWHRRRQTPGSALLFPSVSSIDAKGRFTRSDLGFKAGRFWVEPMAPWSGRSVKALLDRFVYRCGGRTLQGFRVGNNIELRRRRAAVKAPDGEVEDVVRWRLHQRSLRAHMGSEASYTDVFGEDMENATVGLGRRRIERDRDGEMSTTAFSVSAGEHDDWVPLTRPEKVGASAHVGGDSESDDFIPRLRVTVIRRRRMSGMWCVVMVVESWRESAEGAVTC